MTRRKLEEERYKVVDGIEYKKCSTCGHFIPVSEYSTRKASADGLAYSCKVCERNTARESYKRRKQKQKRREHYQDNKEVYIERSKDRYKENKEEILKQQAEWRQTTKGKAAIQKAGKLRRQRITEQTPEGRDYNREEIIKRDSINGTCICQICGQPIVDLECDLEIDHIVPIAAGGSDIKDNVRCTHKVCNLVRPKDGSDIA